MGINLGNLAALRTFRVLRALKTVAIVPGLSAFLNLNMGIIFLSYGNILMFRFEDYRRSRYRVSEESQGCHHSHRLFALSLCTRWTSDIHGSPYAEMCIRLTMGSFTQRI